MTRNAGGFRSFETLVANVVALASGLATSVVLARILGPTGRGELAAAILWPQLLIYLGSFGITTATLYYSAQPRANVNAVFGNSLLLAIVQSGLSILLGFILIPYLLSEQSDAIVEVSRTFLWVIPFSLIGQYGASIIQAHSFIRAFNFRRLIIPIGYLVGVLVLAVFSLIAVERILSLQLVLTILAMGVTLVFLWKLGLVEKIGLDTELGRRMVAYGIKEHVGSISQLANLRLDQTIMAAFLPATQLGYYVVAVSASNIIRVIASAGRILITPRFAQGNEKKIASLLPIVRKYWILNVVAGVALLFVIPFAIPVFFGSDYRDSILPALVLLLAAIFLGGLDLFGSIARGLGEPSLVSKSEIVALVATVIALPILLPTYGILGAAMASLLAYFAAFCFIILSVGREFGIAYSELLKVRKQDLVDLADYTLSILNALLPQAYFRRTGR